MGKVIAGVVLRSVRNGRLNCNDSASEEQKSQTENITYVKKIRKGKEMFPYASGQWQKKNIKQFAEMTGHELTKVEAESTTEALMEGNPLKNYDEDVMGFMVAKNERITKEEYAELSKEEQKQWKSEGKAKGYKKNVTVKRRANLMVSTLQAIRNTRVKEEFAVRETDKTPILYGKEVYSADMSSSFCLDVEKIGKYRATDNEAGYRDYTNDEVKAVGLEVSEDGYIYLDKGVKKQRVETTLKGIHLMPTRTTMSNNLEDLSAKIMIFGEYSIGNSVFNDVFGEGKLKLDYLRSVIEANEEYRLSKIYIGVQPEYFLQDDRYAKEILEDFVYEENKKNPEKDRFVIGTVGEVLGEYIEQLEV